MDIKQPAFAGSWYPGSEKECRQAIDTFLGTSAGEQDKALPQDIVGGIVPHAGWVYSGRIACRIIAALSQKKSVDTVVLFGAHMHPTSPAFILNSGAVGTPLGEIAVDEELTAELIRELDLPDSVFRPLSPSSFPDENTLELQYPFIRHFFPNARIIVCGVPPSEMAGQIAAVLVGKAAALSRTVRVIGSTDMTHYGPNFGFEPAGTGEAAVDWVTRENDANAIQALEKMDIQAIIDQGLSNSNMCCSGAAAAAAAACKKMGAAKGVCLDYATSYEQSRSASFVGYCGMVYGK
ncbi:MAG: AmmeMemoRadiSam system protein B [Desulfobacterales bacterium]|nr:AmmeMemoRadiSam system protein B [Desulfobacterales bacterium]